MEICKIIKDCLIQAGLEEAGIVEFINGSQAQGLDEASITASLVGSLPNEEWVTYYNSMVAQAEPQPEVEAQPEVQPTVEVETPVQEVQEVQHEQVAHVPHTPEETQVSEPQEYELAAATMTPEESAVVVSSKDTIAEFQNQITEITNKMLLVKETLESEGPYVNESYLKCPSYHNLIPPIQKAIAKKREISVSKFWYEKYRPELVEEILFPNKVIKDTIQEFVRKDRIGGHCMFYGDGGVGKTTTNIVLMNAILKNASDRFILDRKIESVDNLKGFLNKKAIGKQKIVIAEEFDRLSDAAMTELKNGLLEKYEDTIFLASTNKIHKIDQALLSRFTLVAKFENADEEELFMKCKFILNNERIVFTDEDVRAFVETNKLKGVRTIINNLQLSCFDRVFEPNRTSFFIGSSGTEYELIQGVKNYIYYLLHYDVNTLYTMMYSFESFPDVKAIRTNIMEAVLYNYNLNYDYVFIDLLKDPNLFLPAKNVIEKYFQEIDIKKIKSMHFEAMLNELTHMIYEFRNIELNWNHKQLTDANMVNNVAPAAGADHTVGLIPNQ